MHAEPLPLHYRALVALDQTYLERDGVRFKLSPGMQVSAEIDPGSRTVLAGIGLTARLTDS